MYSLLSIKPNNNTYPLLLVPPASPATLPLSEQALYCQMAFENLNTPQLSLLPTPLATLFGLNSTTGVVLHVGRTSSEAIVVTDSIVRWETATTVDVGEADCEEWLESLLIKDTALDQELKAAAGVEFWAPGQKEKLVREVREFIFAECTGDDIEVPEAKNGQKSVVVVNIKPQEEEAFDVAKKYVPSVESTSSD
jgi:actin-related protein 9